MCIRDRPIVVITDGATTGSLEYFALAMQLSGRATIVGMPTLGQPFIRRTVFLAGGATMRVPFALLLSLIHISEPTRPY